MKKLLLILGLVAGTFAANAQRMALRPYTQLVGKPVSGFSGMVNAVMPQQSVVRVNDIATVNEAQGHFIIDTLQSWYNLASMLNNTGMVQVGAFTPYMWPDTTTVYDINDTLHNVQWTSAGMAIDPTDPNWALDPSGTIPSLDTFSSSYEVDSVAIPFTYQRVAEVDSATGNPIVDTLVIQICSPEAWYFTNSLGSREWFGTMGFDINTDLAKNGGNGSAILQTIRIPLTSADTSSLTYNIKSRALSNIKISALKGFSTKSTYPICAIYTFKPGTKWSDGDTIGSGNPTPKHLNNVFRFRMDYASADPMLTKANNGLIIQGQQRHNPVWLPVKTQGSKYLVSQDFGAYFMPDVSFYIKAVRKYTGLNEIAQNIAGISLYPNPANDNLNVNVSMNKSDNVTVRISDMLGQQVAVLANGNMLSGNHTINVNTSSLKSGVYFCTVSTSNGSQTQRFVVSK